MHSAEDFVGRTIHTCGPPSTHSPQCMGIVGQEPGLGAGTSEDSAIGTKPALGSCNTDACICQRLDYSMPRRAGRFVKLWVTLRLLDNGNIYARTAHVGVVSMIVTLCMDMTIPHPKAQQRTDQTPTGVGREKQ